ncbi:unnamed protein product [Adineta ricciae]|uniref:RING-type domain-containing protein n=1 Tax=Adineta ricciae TaxID=249248 RepID=A0A814ZR93_ADIRI|nr:unnamed protein product [Adineta ricciae]CAF1611843.1 unnamed protein product [Adineta ricciae]
MHNFFSATMMRQNELPLTKIDSLSKEIECIMCLDVVNDSRMCIHCSAIVCVQCIESWLKVQSICPKCLHLVEETDFVKCRLANKLADFIEVSKDDYSKQCVSTNEQNIDVNYREIMTLNSKLLDFFRRRCKDYGENLAKIESATQTLLNDKKEIDVQEPLDAYQKKRQAYTDAIRDDKLLIDNMEYRLRESQTLSDQEEILQILQKHIPSKVQFKDH